MTDRLAYQVERSKCVCVFVYAYATQKSKPSKKQTIARAQSKE